jgi:superfamily II DNA or RNA helicase
MSVELRPYQDETIDRIADGWRAGHRSQLAALATGLGKTITFAELTRRVCDGSIDLPELPSTDTLVLAHRDELIQQAVEKMAVVWPEAFLSTGIVKGRSNDTEAPIVAASVQTLANENRLAAMSHRTFGVIHVDEGHHATAPTYLRILDAFGARDPHRTEGPLVVLWTATPDRADGVGLRNVADHVAASFDLLWGVRAGYLVEPRGIAVDLNLDLDEVKSSRGDWQDGDLGRALMDADVSRYSVKAWREHADGRPTLAFYPTVQTATAAAEAFTADGISAAIVSGETPDAERSDIVERYKAGGLQVVTNVGVFTEGFDAPATSCVLVARPTMSRALYTQMIGRGTRKHPAKSDLLVIDLVGNSDRHELVTLATLAGASIKTMRKHGGRLLATADATKTETAAGDLHELHSREVDLWAQRIGSIELAWHEGDDGRYYLAIKQGTVTLLPKGDAWAAVALPSKGEPRVLVEGVDLSTAQGVGDDHVRNYVARQASKMRTKSATAAVAQATALVRPNATWRQRPPSEKSKALASRLGVRTYRVETQGELSDLIDRARADQRLRRAGLLP